MDLGRRPGSYHTPTDPSKSRINTILTGPAVIQATTALSAGRMRAIVDCDANASIGEQGTFRVELSIPGKPTLSDERQTQTFPLPAANPGRQKKKVPAFEITKMLPDDDTWEGLGWGEPNTVASSSSPMNGILQVYYNAAFPDYANRHKPIACLFQKNERLSRP